MKLPTFSFDNSNGTITMFLEIALFVLAVTYAMLSRVLLVELNHIMSNTLWLITELIACSFIIIIILRDRK